MEGLFARLTEYGASQYYPFHMPGHKRNMPEEIGALQGIAGLDITEIEGFDDLHAPDGILKEAQEKAAVVFGAEETFFLVIQTDSGSVNANTSTSLGEIKTIITKAPLTVITVVSSCTTSSESDTFTVSIS